jgi:hypothetical protein
MRRSYQKGPHQRLQGNFEYSFGAFPAFIDTSFIKQKGGTYMSLADFKDMEFWQANRRKFLKILALTGTVSLVDLFAPCKKMGFAKEGDITPEEMRQKAIQVFMKPNPFM